LEKSLVKRVLQYPKLITAIIVVLIFAVLGIWLWRSSFKTEKQEQEQDLGKKITEYVEGMELIPDTLNSYENQWKNKKPKITESLLSMLFPFWVEKDSTEYKEWNKTMQKINTAILLRGLIRNHNFAELKKQNYSAEQDSFKQTVISYIDSALYQEVGDSLKKKNEDLDKMKLSDITITINSIVNSIKEKGTPKRKVEAKKPEARTENTHIPQDNSQAQTQPVSPASTDKTKKIKNYLQGDELKKDSLERYKKDANTTLKASIDLCLEFWRLVKEENNQMDNFCDLLTKIKNNDTLKTSELKTFLDGICANSEAFSKYNSSPGKRKYQTLKNLKNNIR
jgi:hypothetical protein